MFYVIPFSKHWLTFMFNKKFCLFWVHTTMMSPKNYLFLNPAPLFTPFPLVTNKKMTEYFQISHPQKCSLGSVLCFVCLLHNTPYLTSTSTQLNDKTCLIFASWHQLDVICYVSFKVQKFCCKMLQYFWLEWKCFLGGFLQIYILYKHTERCFP